MNCRKLFCIFVFLFCTAQSRYEIKTRDGKGKTHKYIIEVTDEGKYMKNLEPMSEQ